MKKRTECDFTKHELQIFSEPHTKIYHLKLAGTTDLQVLFCNIFYGHSKCLFVTGAFGHWSFRRSFCPYSEVLNGRVSDSCWCEKAEQTTHVFDVDGTRKKINDEIEKLTIDCVETRCSTFVKEYKEYLEDLLDNLNDVETEEEYYGYAHDTLPNSLDYEYIPIVRKINTKLEIIFDAMEEICSRLYAWETKLTGMEIRYVDGKLEVINNQEDKTA